MASAAEADPQEDQNDTTNLSIEKEIKAMVTSMCMNIDNGEGAKYLLGAGLNPHALTKASVIVWGRLPGGIGTPGSDAKKTAVMLLVEANGKPVVVEMGLEQLELIVKAFRAADEGDKERRESLN